MSYDLVDWFIDACERGRCLNCKGFTLERLGTLEAQCYSCGKWFCGYQIGSSHDSFVELSTAYQRTQKQRGHAQTYDNQSFEAELSQSLKSPESFGDYPEEDI